MDTASSAQIPYTHYHCPCLSPIDTDKAPSYDKDRGFSLAHLYYCEECDALRCSRCITSEIVTYYCPNCLFEVPGASVRGERNRCARNCFACPLCQAVLTVNGDPDGKSYWLSCGSCRWQSRQVGYEFEKPTGVALQVQKVQDSKPSVGEFERLKEHFDKHFRSTTQASKAGAAYFSSPMSNSSAHSSPYYGISSRFGLMPPVSTKEDLPDYEITTRGASSAAAIKEDDPSLLDKIRSMDTLDGITTMEQRLNQIDNDMPRQTSNLAPQRILLRIKRSKRCRACRHILIKPEQKAQATRFKIKLVALNYIPNIHLYPPTHPLRANRSFHAVLKFSNPLYDEIQISLGTHCPEERGRVTVVAPQFSVAPFNEVWEYDDEELGEGLGHSKGTKTEHGIVERRGNSTSVMIEIGIGDIKVGQMFTFSLLVSFTYKPDEGAGEEKSFSFWTTLGVGTVVEPPPPKEREVEMIS